MTLLSHIPLTTIRRRSPRAGLTATAGSAAAEASPRSGVLSHGTVLHQRGPLRVVAARHQSPMPLALLAAHRGAGWYRCSPRGRHVVGRSLRGPALRTNRPSSASSLGRVVRLVVRVQRSVARLACECRSWLVRLCVFR